MLRRVFVELSAFKMQLMRLEAHVNTIKFTDLEDYLKDMVRQNPPDPRLGPLEDMWFDSVTLFLHDGDDDVQQYINLYLKEKQ